MSFKRVIALLTIPAMLLSLGAGCQSGSSPSSAEQITLTYWRVFDDKDAFSDIIDAYHAIHPNVRIEYKKLRPEEYEGELLRALAEGSGPDIFSVHNTKMGEYQSLLQPMPTETNVTYQVTKGTLRKETVLEPRKTSTLSQKAFKQQFVDVVADDAVLAYQPDPDVAAQSRIFGLPLAVDTLSLFYNRQLLNAAGIAEPPATWEEFMAAVKKLTKYDTNGNVLQSGAALGTVKNVDRPTDILSVLMMQNGTNMTDDRGRVAFQTIPPETQDGVFPGLDAVRFYSDFANPTKDVYTWNDDFPNALQAFANGQTAFYLGYSYDIPLLQSAAPKLNYGIATLPQIAGPGEANQVNYANYWLEGVSKTSKHSDYAWDFLLFASNAEHVGTYLSKAEKPTALRGLISSQLDDEKLGVFAEELLTARSWYHGKDADAAEKALGDLITAIRLGVEDERNTIEKAAKIVSQTY